VIAEKGTKKYDSVDTVTHQIDFNGQRVPVIVLNVLLDEEKAIAWAC
jgi:hypothetical protein